MRRYIPEFDAIGAAPYLGMRPGMVCSDDVATLPADVTAVSLGKKCKHVERLPDFAHLRRVDCYLTAETLPALACMPGLEHVKLWLPKSADIPSLACLTGLRSLVLKANRHQLDLEFLRGMEWLHSLCISEAVGVTSLAPLASLAELRELYIDGKISSRGTVESLAPLAELTRLRFAVLLLRVVKEHRTLQPLHGLSELQFLYLSPDYTDAEYAALLAALPQLAEIRFNGGRRWPAARSGS